MVLQTRVLVFAIMATVMAALRPEIYPAVSRIEINETQAVTCQVPNPPGTQTTMYFKYDDVHRWNLPPGITQCTMIHMPCKSVPEITCATLSVVVTGREDLNGTRLTCCAVDSQDVLNCSEGHSLITVYNSVTAPPPSSTPPTLTPPPTTLPTLTPPTSILPTLTPPRSTPPTLTTGSPDPSPNTTRAADGSGTVKSSKLWLPIMVLLTVNMNFL